MPVLGDAEDRMLLPRAGGRAERSCCCWWGWGWSVAFVGAEDENGDGAILRTSPAVELDGWECHTRDTRG